jgi:TRAP-type C4-dicarboxylate transport system substrate-binding protein
MRLMMRCERSHGLKIRTQVDADQMEMFRTLVADAALFTGSTTNVCTTAWRSLPERLQNIIDNTLNDMAERQRGR